MKMAIYYVVVSLSFAILSAVSPETADAAVIGFICLLLIPACYGEYLRIRRHGH